MPILALEAENLVKTYKGGGSPAVDGISFAVAPGMVFGLLGPNGSGKTTTVRILVTLLKPGSGIARVCGFDVARQPGNVRRVIGYAGQSGQQAKAIIALAVTAAVLAPATVASFRSIKE